VGEPALALDRVRNLKGNRWRAWAIEAEAHAMLGDLDALDRVLTRVRDEPQLERVPRVAAQFERARGIAGDEFALRSAARTFEELGCRFERARCLELLGQDEDARLVYEQFGAEPALCRVR
jgi:hypothetical protein